MNRPIFERLLDAPQRWIEASRLSKDARLFVLSLIRYLKQIARSRSRRA